MTEPAAPTPPPEPQTVDFCLPCAKCWYDLRGIGVCERCPECGTPVRRTMRSLFASDLKYLVALRRKLSWIEGLWTANFLIVLSMPFVSKFAPSWAGFGGVSAAHVLLFALPLLVHGGALLSAVIRPEGRVPRVERAGGVRWATAMNWSLGCAAACTVGAASLAIAHRVDEFELHVLIGVCATAVLLVLRNLALAPHFRRMGRRLRLKMRWGTPWFWPVVGVVLLVVYAVVNGVLGGNGPMAQALGTAGGIMFFIGLCAALGEVAKFRKRVRDVVRFRESGGKVVPRGIR